MMRRHALPAALLVSLAAASAPLPADEVTDQIDAARQAYEAGELRSAVQTLQFAVASIQEKVNLSLLDLLPAPLEGWSADEPQAQSGGMAAMIAGTNLSRRYYREDGAEVEVSITADSPLLPMMTMMLSNPMMLQSSPGTRVYTHEGRRGTIQHEADSRHWEITLMLSNNVLVQVSGSGVEEREPVESYLKAMDLAAVQKAFGG
jgi:hypothetical protein